MTGEPRLFKLKPPLRDSDVTGMKIGDKVLITGLMYGCRDAAHKNMVELLDKGNDLPVDLRGQILYYVGPTPAPKGRLIGAAGPTTSGRMDAYAPRMYDYGVKATVGKGTRTESVVKSMVKNKAVYLVAIGGLGATLASKIKGARVAAWPELGTEALWEFRVEDFPAIVGNDVNGGDIYRESVRYWAEKLK